MKNNVQGRVIVQFVIEKDGTPTEFKVARSVDPDLDAEALACSRPCLSGSRACRGGGR